MDRKTFLKQSGQLGVASGCMLLFGRKNTSTKEDDMASKREQKFKEDWVVTLMENLEERFDEKTRCAFMESCGRDCAKRGAISLAESCKGDVNTLTAKLAQIPQVEITHGKNGPIKVSYKKCFCELVSKGPERLPDTYCECSKGWLLQMFETASQKPVKVEIIQTIKRGGTACDFLVQV